MGGRADPVGGMSDEALLVAGQAVSLRSLVADRLRLAIVTGRFRPGQQLRERELCELTGVSRPSLREALRQSEAEGLITTTTHRGTLVAALSVEEVGQLYALRGSRADHRGAANRHDHVRLLHGMVGEAGTRWMGQMARLRRTEGSPGVFPVFAGAPTEVAEEIIAAHEQWGLNGILFRMPLWSAEEMLRAKPVFDLLAKASIWVAPESRNHSW